jgi:hypothetical protein
METGTQIILQRMKDNPEEFPNEGELHGKWGRLINDARGFLPKEDVEALDAAYRQLIVDRYNERVLKTLAGEDKETVIYKAKGRYAGGFSDPRAFANAAVKAEGQAVGYDDRLDVTKYITGAQR